MQDDFLDLRSARFRWVLSLVGLEEIFWEISSFFQTIQKRKPITGHLTIMSMNIVFTPNELNNLADQLAKLVLARFETALQQASKSSRPSLVWLKVDEVAAQLQVSEKTVHKYIKEGRVKAKNISTSHDKPTWRVSQQWVDDFWAA